MRIKKLILKTIASIVTVTFTAVQIGWAGEIQPLPQAAGPRPQEQSIEEAQAESRTTTDDGRETSQEFLEREQTLTLTDSAQESWLSTSRGRSGQGSAEDVSAESAGRVSSEDGPRWGESSVDETRAPERKYDSQYEYERYTFEEAVEQLRTEYATAVIVKSITRENIESLLNLSFEVGIAVFGGETVLFTSGNEEEIRTLLPSIKLLDEASFISHTHVTEESQNGPSLFDLQHAVEAPFEEYVLTKNGAYSYNHDGIRNEGKPYSADEYFESLNQSIQEAQKKDQTDTRTLLNEFIKQADVYNETSWKEIELFRLSANIIGVTTDNFNRTTLGSQWTAPKGTWKINYDGATGLGSLYMEKGAGGNFSCSKSNPGILVLSTPPGSYDYEVEADFRFENPEGDRRRGIVARYLDDQNYYLGEYSVKEGKYRIVRFQDGVATVLNEVAAPVVANGSTHRFGFSVKGSSLELMFDGSVVVSTEDFLLQTGTVGFFTQSKDDKIDNFEVVTYTEAPRVNPPFFTNNPNFVLGGTKQSGTSIWIDGVEQVAANASTTWSWPITLGADGQYTYAVQAKYSDGSESEMMNVTVTLDRVKPTGTLSINSDNAYANSINVTLNLLGSDNRSGVDKVRFKNVGGAWSEWEDYSEAKSFELLPGDGLKEVRVQFMDQAGNISLNAIDTITLDTVLPTGSVVINSGSTSTQSADVALTLTASDDDSGISQVRFSTDEGKTWTSWESYSANRALTLPPQGGLWEVRYQVQDIAGNISTFTDTIIYNRILSDGTQLFYNGNVLNREVTPEGDEILYGLDESVLSYEYVDGVKIVYSQSAPHHILIYAADQTLLETVEQIQPTLYDDADLLKLTLDGGLAAFYFEEELVEIRTSSGIRVTDFTLNENNEIQNAILTYPDGSYELTRNGSLLRRVSADGSIVDFAPIGLPVREILTSAVQYYFFEKESQNSIVGTRIFTPTGAFSYYDELGILREVQGDSGEHFVYNRQNSNDHYTTTLNVSQSTTPSTQGLASAQYTKITPPEGDPYAQINQINLQDGTQIHFEEGVMTEVLDPQGNIVDYSYIQDQGLVQGLTVNRQGNVFHYAQDGFLNTIETSEGTIYRQAIDTNGDGRLIDETELNLLLQTANGTRLTDFELDANGNILNGLIETAEGIKQRIENGILVGFETVDGKVYDFDGERALLTEWKFRDGTRILYGGESITQILFPNGNQLHTIGFSEDKKLESFVEQLADGTEKYFKNNHLVKLITPSATEIDYDANGLAYRITLPDASEEQVFYTYNEAGEIEEIAFQGETTYRTFQPDGTLLRLLTNGVGAVIENDEVTQLFTRYGTVENPQYNQTGILSGEIDFADGAKQILQDGVLIQTIRPNGTIVNYVNGRIDSIQTVNGTYQLIYVEDAQGKITDIRVRLDSVNGDPEIPLLPFLEDPEIQLASALGNDFPEYPVSYFGNAHVEISQILPQGNVLALDGTGDYISVEPSQDFAIGQEDFTVDFWFKPDQTKNHAFFSGNGSNSDWMRFYYNSSRFEFGITGGSLHTYTSSNLSNDEWHHLAVVRIDGVLKLFIDGTQLGSDVVDNTAISNSGNIRFGEWSGLAASGQMNNIRISRGVARWTNSFTPSMASPEMDNYTKLFIHFDAVEETNPLFLDDVQEISSILLARPLHNALSDSQSIQSELLTGVFGHSFKTFGDAGYDSSNAALGDGSAHFDGSGDYIEVDHDSDFNFGTENWTIDFQTKFDQQAAEYYLYRKGNHLDGGISIIRHAGINRWDILVAGNTVLSVNSTIATGQWIHVALVRDGSTLKLFQNGQLIGSTAINNGGNVTNANPLYLGSYQGSSNFFPGNIDELRISKGVARWTANFVPPTEEYERDANTVLLLHFSENEFQKKAEMFSLDNAVNNTVFTASLLEDYRRGMVAQLSGTYYPEWDNIRLDSTQWNQGYVSRNVRLDVAPDATDKLPSLTTDLVDINGDGLLDRVMVDPTSGVDYWWVQLNNGNGFDNAIQWTGVERRSNNYGLSNYDQRLTTMRFFEGRHPTVLGELIDINGDGLPDRVFQGNQGYPETYVQLNNGHGFDPVNADYSKKVYVLGDVKVDTEQNKIGEGSALFDGNGDYLEMPFSDDFEFGTGDFTIDLWANFTNVSGTQTLISRDNTGDFRIQKESNGNLRVHLEGQSKIQATWNPAVNQWYHIALVRENGQLKLFVDGEQLGSTVVSAENITSARELRIGQNSSSNYFKGYLDEIRVSKGVARWVSDFTPPSEAYARDENTVLLLHMEGEDESQYFVDDSKESYGFHNIHPVSQWSFQAEYALEVRNDANGKDVQELIADLVDMDGDGLLDRVVRPYVETEDCPFTCWHWQKNYGDHFADAYLWEGVDPNFDPDTSIGGSLSWHVWGGQDELAELSLLMDIDGDGLPDRILLKNKNQSDPNSAMDWYIQKNSGTSFDPPILWDDDVRVVPGAPNEKMGSSIRWFNNAPSKRWILADLRDVNGDGLPDRVTLPQGGTDAVQSSWFVELNTGTTFAPAVEWTGIYGMNGAETSIGQDNWDFRSNRPIWMTPDHFERVSDLVDMNGDGFLDRVIFPAGTDHWLIQYGTGAGFLPVESMLISAIQTSTTDIHSARYDYLHVSVKSETAIPSEEGYLHVTLGMPENPQSYQEWTIENIDTEWKDIYLKLDPDKSDASQVKVEFVPVNGEYNTPIYVDNVTFTRLRSDATKDWLDRLLTEEDVLSEIYSDRTQTLASYLGLAEAQDAQTIDWEKLLTAEIRIDFDAQGEATEFETLYGSVSQVENGQVVETVLRNETRIQFEVPDPNNPNHFTQTINNSDGSVQNIDLSYGRVRSISREGQASLQYSYEFDELGNEITVVHDPDTQITERYRDFTVFGSTQSLLISRAAVDGIVTSFEYDEKGNVIHSYISYKDRVRETFEHGISSEGNALITTEAGIQEEYDSEGNILYHTTAEGYRYHHSFEPERSVTTNTETITETFADGTTFTYDLPTVTLEENPDGEILHRITLTDYFTETGTHATYDRNVLTGVVFPEGLRISFDRFEIKENFNPETGESIQEVLLLDATVFHTDGTKTQFKDSMPYSVTSATGNEIFIEKEDGLLINPNESAEFHYAQAEQLWNDVVNSNWNTFQPPAELAVLSEYDKDGKIVTREYAEGTTELYENGRIQQTLSPTGERFVQYDYDEEGNPIRIEMEGARRRLQSAVLKLQAEVAIESESALKDVAERKKVLNQTIEGEYLVKRDRLLAIRAQIEEQRNYLASIDARGKQAQSLISDAMAQIQGGIDQVNQALKQLADQRKDALSQLDDQVEDAETRINTETANAYAEIEIERDKAQNSILNQEVTPVIYHWYREILGRDPSRAEYDEIILNMDYNCPQGLDGQGDCAEIVDGEASPWLVALKTKLIEDPELIERQNQVQAIKAKVRSEITNYLGLSDAEKLLFAQSLGVASEDLVQLLSGEANAILDWLDGNSLHFGQSAYLALEMLLQNAGLTRQDPDYEVCKDNPANAACSLVDAANTYSRYTIAVKLILIDILTGTLTPLENDDLLLSVYALNHLATTYGVETHAMKLTFEALKALYDEACGANPENCSFRLIAHVDGNHFIVITKVTDDEITFIDPGAGPENALDVQTLSKEDFLKTWINPSEIASGFGYVLSLRGPPESLDETQAQYLTTHEQMKVRGAFFGLIFALIFTIIQIVAAIVSAVVSAVAAIVGSLVFGIASILSGFGSLLAGFFSGVFLSGLQGLFAGIAGFFGQIFGGFAALFQFGSALASSFLGSSAVANALQFSLIGLAFQGLGLVLDAIGLTPKLSQSFVSGAKLLFGIGMLFTGNPIAIGAALGYIAGGTSELLSLHTSLSPTITNILGIGAAALGAFTTGNLTSALPFLASDLATAGLVGIGNALGLDPRITSLISIPVGAAVSGFTGSLLGLGNATGNLLVDIGNKVFSYETLGGLVSLGASVGLEELGAPPILQSFIPSLLGGIVSGLGSGGGGPGDSQEAGESLFKKILDNIAKFGKGVIAAGQQVISFGQKALEGFGNLTTAGFSKAVEFFSGIFDRQTQEILTNGGSQSIEDTLNSSCSALISGIHCVYQSVQIDYDLNGDMLSYTNGNSEIYFEELIFNQGYYGGSVSFYDDFGDGVLVYRNNGEGVKIYYENSNQNEPLFHIIGDELIVRPDLYIKQNELGQVDYELGFGYEGFESAGNSFLMDDMVPKGIADIAKELMLSVIDYGYEVFEGTQIGAGIGAEAKVKLGAIELRIGMSELDVKQITSDGVIDTSDSFAGFELTVGKWHFKFDATEDGNFLDKIEVSRDVGNNSNIDNSFTVGFGGTVTNPYTGSAVNAEININLLKLRMQELLDHLSGEGGGG